MNKLFFDTETTGLPEKYKASYKNVDNWPRMVQLAWIVYEDDVEVSSGNFLIQPVGFTIPDESIEIHGHTHEQCLNEGAPLRIVLNQFWAAVKASDVLIAHNVDFDKNIVASELYRLGAHAHADHFMMQPMFCTMQSTTDFCKLPGKYGLKWPKLEELYSILFQEQLQNNHDALVDIRATAKCFVELKKRGIITI